MVVDKIIGVKTALAFVYYDACYKLKEKQIKHCYCKNMKRIENLEKKKSLVQGNADAVSESETDFEKSEPIDVDFSESNCTEESECTEVRVIQKLSSDDVEVIDPVYDPVFLSDDELDENIEEAYKHIKADGNQIKLLILSIFYTASIIKPEQMYKRCKTQDDLEFINSVVKFYSGLPIFPQYTTLSINEVVSIKLLKDVVDYESGYEKLFDNEAISAIVNKSSQLLTAFEKKSMEINGVKGQEPTIPLFFTSKNMNLTGNFGVPKNVVSKLEKELGEILHKYAHQFNKVNDLIELVIYDNGRMDSYYIDPGTIIGNGFNVICNIPGDTIMVNIKHKDILEKVFENVLYILTPEEIQRVSQDMFSNARIYFMMDMSKGPEILPKLSEEEFVKLGKKLTFILNLPWNPNNIPFGRLRFRSFKSIDDFVLVSDDKCKSPLPPETFETISPGLSIKIEGDDIIVKYGELTNKYKIEQYNVL